MHKLIVASLLIELSAIAIDPAIFRRPGVQHHLGNPSVPRAASATSLTACSKDSQAARILSGPPAAQESDRKEASIASENSSATLAAGYSRKSVGGAACENAAGAPADDALG